MLRKVCCCFFPSSKQEVFSASNHQEEYALLPSMPQADQLAMYGSAASRDAYNRTADTPVDFAVLNKFGSRK